MQSATHALMPSNLTILQVIGCFHNYFYESDLDQKAKNILIMLAEGGVELKRHV